MDANSIITTADQSTDDRTGDRSNWWFLAAVAVGAGTG